jgi:hypothetical protein
MQKVISYLILALFLSGCDCIQKGGGVVLDAATNLPIDSVKIRRMSKRESELAFYSGKDGSFEARYISGGLWGCPDLKLEISKEGYRSQRVVNPRNDTIYLSK